MKSLLAAWLIVIGTSTAALAEGPREVVQASLERVATILRQAEPNEPSATARERADQRRQEIRRVAGELFDFEETSRRTLARHWAGLAPEERAEFVRLFAEVLEHAFLNRIEDYSGEQLVWAGETVDGDLASVRAKIIGKRGETPLDYRLHLRDGRWRVYDLMIDGMSFVGIYRSQFDRILRTESIGSLLERMRRKTFQTAGVVQHSPGH